jgi:hypothetical protein
MRVRDTEMSREGPVDVVLPPGLPNSWAAFDDLPRIESVRVDPEQESVGDLAFHGRCFIEAMVEPIDRVQEELETTIRLVKSTLR